MKEKICALMGVCGAAVASWFGGWDTALETLIVFMILDYVSGMMIAGVFKKSKKSKSGGLESWAGWKGLCRKGGTLAFVAVANHIDLLAGTHYIRDTVTIGFITNELLSLIENAGVMGIPLPDVVKKAVDILNQKKDSISKEA